MLLSLKNMIVILNGLKWYKKITFATFKEFI